MEKIFDFLKGFTAAAVFAGCIALYIFQTGRVMGRW